MTYRQRLSLFIAIDSSIVLTAIFISSLLVSADLNILTFPIIMCSIVILSSHHFFAVVLKLYKKVWEYASIAELLIIFKVVTFSIIIAAIVQQFILHDNLFRILVITWMLHILLIGSSRFFWRMYRDRKVNSVDHKKRTLIIGAGSAGTMVARQLLKSNEGKLLPVAFIDDEFKKHHLDILGIPVVGGIGYIETAVEKLNIDYIIIAIPSLSKKRLNIIFEACSKTKTKTQILPMLEDLVTGKVSVTQFRDVQVEDLLGRETVQLNIDKILGFLTNKVVLVTGAGGSIGSEICRQVSTFSPYKIILLGHGENSIYSIELELKEKYGHTDIEFITEIADIQDANRMTAVMKKHRPTVVYHAAAHKHVPLMERNPEEAVKNNLIGTKNVAMAASLAGVETFVMISSDKAVNPTSVMGATKRLSEMLIQNLDKTSNTKFVAVRFGNVLGSRGSVIPLFKKQIEKGGPVTITHPEMVRYFMTIPEASRLVIQAGSLAKGGEIFVLDMGEPVKIVDLARKLIVLSGHSLEDIEIEFTGMRPGEKLYEELLKAEEVQEQQIYPKIYIGKTVNLYMKEIEDIMNKYSSLDKESLTETLLNLANNNFPIKPLLTIPS
ncbi:polysaccharide biosynthesis protein [Anaerobacillus isosaccharinicus]|uniref:Polysaccharide biosynthesis protein n=1 Tax=Anaerobacillus isosaccharinicus TaxID=1532552 RepID=A0A1S2KYQ5_9BACI|nr:nucleoside-diphosphate sugar epimerase/dehydratase [Anaerobacillus isosaccharinicus]MBA5586890.1 polysaccharide biosynthesis protein [Anaerobacillus isosaccharinicus]QOY34901.1 polysaccharide biosynthesis protein [Anaerobacillus isosaccharinicus]